MTASDDDYPCVGICMTDAETGHCLGCGRPSASGPLVAIEEKAGVAPGAAALNIPVADNVTERAPRGRTTR